MISTLLALTLHLTLPSAHASLGDDSSSIDRDQKHFSAKRGQAVNHSNYTVHELTSASLTVHEFINQNGKVFAISWKGVHQPELSSILNTYFSEFETAQKKSSKAAIRSPFHRIESDRLIVDRGGHMRASYGKAYLKNELPKGVSINEISIP